jgi:hypothetical protein
MERSAAWVCRSHESCVAELKAQAHHLEIDSGGGLMPLYKFHVLTSAGEAEMELGFHRDEAAVAYAERLSDAAEIEIWRASELLTTVGAVVELADA